MIYGNGIDIININRIRKVIDKYGNRFKNNRFLYFTASVNTEGGEGSNTGLYRAKYDNVQLTDITLLYKATPNSTVGRHYGSKILIDENYIFFTIGDKFILHKQKWDSGYLTLI